MIHRKFLHRTTSGSRSGVREYLHTLHLRRRRPRRDEEVVIGGFARDLTNDAGLSEARRARWTLIAATNPYRAGLKQIWAWVEHGPD